MPVYSNFEEFLNTQNGSIELKFSEIEKIVGPLPKSAYDYQEWWSNHPSHPLMKVILKNGWKQRNLDLFLKKVEFYQIKNILTKIPKKQLQKKDTNPSNKSDNKFKLVAHELEIDGLVFTYICEILPKVDALGNIVEFFPQERFENKGNLKLNKYGVGPFCKFTVDKKFSNKAGVYLLMVEQDIRYVGECDDFYKRYNMGYGNISPRNCFDGGQPTNCRINSSILSSIKSNNSVNLYFLETEERFKIEYELIQSQRPLWNKTSGKPSKIQ